MPVRFASTGHKLESSRKRELNWENVAIRLPVGKSLGHLLDKWLIWEGPANCGWRRSWAGEPELCEKTGWGVNRWEQPGSSVCCFSSWGRALPSLSDELCSGWVRQIKPFFPRFLSVTMFITATDSKLTERWSKFCFSEGPWTDCTRVTQAHVRILFPHNTSPSWSRQRLDQEAGFG